MDSSAARRSRSPEHLLAELLAIAPHVAARSRELTWLDARGLSAERVATAALSAAARNGLPSAGVGAARTAVAAQVAAMWAGPPQVGAGRDLAAQRAPDASDKERDGGDRSSRPRIVAPGADRRFLAPFPAGVLTPSPRLAAALADVGIETCGDLAALTREAVEVRFGAECVAVWRLARADDRRRIFPPSRRPLPSASLTWEEYTLRDPERLVFVGNRLAGAVCTELREWGEAARAMTLGLALANQQTLERPIHSARATASRAAWTRLIRMELERLELPDAVTGLSLRVEAVSAGETRQGDLFDRGFQTALAAEEALARVLDDGYATLVGLVTSGHALLERRARWRARDITEALQRPSRGRPERRQMSAAFRSEPGGPRLTLQLLPDPRRIAVTTIARRGRRVPVRYRDRASAREGARGVARELDVITAAGPDCVSGGMEVAAPYAREYFQCLTAEGVLVLLFRDALADRWYLHGWWD